METSTEAEALRGEFLELLALMYGTALTGMEKATALMAGTTAGLLVTQCGLLAALFILDETAAVAMVMIVVALTFWWFWTTNKEVAKHEAVAVECEKMKKRLAEIEREYAALTGTELRGTFMAQEVREAFEPVFKKRGIPLPPIEQQE